MTRARYSVKESINRVLRLLEGKGAASEQPETLIPDVLSENEAWSDIAEILAGSLPNEAAEVPAAFVATAAEVNAGTVNDKVLTPYGHTISHEFGGIYMTGAIQDDRHFPANVYTKITGAFTNFTLDSGAEILCDWNDDRLILNEAGVWFIYWSLSFGTDEPMSYSIAPFLSGTIQNQANQYGDVIISSMTIYTAGFGPINVPDAGGWPVDLRIEVFETGTVLAIYSGQLYARKEIG